MAVSFFERADIVQENESNCSYFWSGASLGSWQSVSWHQMVEILFNEMESASWRTWTRNPRDKLEQLNFFFEEKGISFCSSFVINTFFLWLLWTSSFLRLGQSCLSELSFNISKFSCELLHRIIKLVIVRHCETLVVFYIITKKQENIVSSIRKEEMTGIILPYPTLVRSWLVIFSNSRNVKPSLGRKL